MTEVFVPWKAVIICEFQGLKSLVPFILPIRVRMWTLLCLIITHRRDLELPFNVLCNRLRLIRTMGCSANSVLLLVGSRADQLGSVSQEYLQKLWDQAQEVGMWIQSFLNYWKDDKLQCFQAQYNSAPAKSLSPNLLVIGLGLFERQHS